jgi:hypothetical protein
MVEIDSVPGQIYDVDATRILYRLSDSAIAIKDRATEDLTTISLPHANPPAGGFLTSHGAIYATSTSTAPFRHLYERRDGTDIDRGPFDSFFRVAGNFAAWTNGTALFREDLSTGTIVQIASDAGNTQNDVAADGDVAYWTTDFSIMRYPGLVGSDTLATGDETHWESYPVTDGTNVVWRETGNNTAPPASLRGYGPAGPFALADTTRDGEPLPGIDYRVSGGFVAFTRAVGNQGDKEIWLREPDGTEADVGPGGENTILGLAADGDVMYAARQIDGRDGIVLVPHGGDPVPVALLPAGAAPSGERGFGNFAFKSGGHWYATAGGSLRRVSPDATVDGTHTSIVSAPAGDDNPTTATISFTTAPAATLECARDGDTYQECESPVNYTGLQNGPHTFAVRAVDANGDVETEPATVQWGVERNRPAVGLDLPDGFLTPDRTPTFGGAAGTATEDTEAVTLRIYRFGDPDHLVRTVEGTRTGGTWSIAVGPPLPDGLYSAQASQSDLAGNVGVSEERSFVVDATPPTPALTVSPLPVLPGHEVTFDAGGSSDNEGVVRYEWDLDGDGDFERDTGPSHVAKTTYSATGEVHPAVRASDRAGNRATRRITVVVAPEPPPGLVGVTINDGERFTNDPNVFVSPVWPAGRTRVILSNDGGFRDPVAAPLANNVPWRLDSSGPERLPKTIYARFTPDGATYQDDIILDETPPALVLAEITSFELVAARAHGKLTFHLHLRARDRTAGVSRMQITTNRARPGKGHRYRSHVKFRARSSQIFVRVRDRAGNWSRWKQCKQ